MHASIFLLKISGFASFCHIRPCWLQCLFVPVERLGPCPVILPTCLLRTTADVCPHGLHLLFRMDLQGHRAWISFLMLVGGSCRSMVALAFSMLLVLQSLKPLTPHHYPESRSGHSSKISPSVSEAAPPVSVPAPLQVRSPDSMLFTCRVGLSLDSQLASTDHSAPQGCEC